MPDAKTKHWIVGLVAIGGAACTDPHPPNTTKPPIAGRLAVGSAALRPDAPIPFPYACTDYEHLGQSPPLAWSMGPEGTVAYAVTMIDSNAKGFVHWALVDLPLTTTSLPEGASPGGALPAGAVELPNDFDKKGYGGPCPPPGAVHHYVLEVRALKSRVDGTKANAALLRALDAAALASGSITVTFKR